MNLILGAAVGYSAEQIRPFVRSLSLTGYKDRVILFANEKDGAFEEIKKHGYEVLKPGPKLFDQPHVNRFFWIRDFLRAANLHHWHHIVCLDTRDVLFQSNPEIEKPIQAVHVFQEHHAQTIGSCPYNSDWIRTGYGEEGLSRMGHQPIYCVGSFCGPGKNVSHYLEGFCLELYMLQSKTAKYQDQAVHNSLIFLDAPPPQFTRHTNDNPYVHTVGYIPREQVQIHQDRIVNAVGYAPVIIHQWDRHQNLQAWVKEKYMKSPA